MAKRTDKPSMPARRYGVAKPIKANGKLKDFTSPTTTGSIKNVPVVTSGSRRFKHIDVYISSENISTEQRDYPLTFVPDVTDAATYRNILTEIEKDFRDDQRSTQWRTLKSLLRFQQ